MNGLERIKTHPTITKLQEVADMLIDVADSGYALLDALRQIPKLAAVAQEAKKYERLPDFGQVFREISRAGDTLHRAWKNSFQEPANFLEYSILDPGVKLLNGVSAKIALGINTLSAFGLAASNLLRPKSTVFQEIAEKLQICGVLESALPLHDATGFLLQFLQLGIPVFQFWPTNPFIGSFIHGAAANLKRVFSFIIQKLRAFLNFLGKTYPVCLTRCRSITIAEILQGSSTILKMFGFVRGQLKVVAKPLGNMRKKVADALDKLTPNFLTARAIASGRRLAATAPSHDNLPDLSDVARRFESPDLLAVIEQEEASVLEGCIFSKTGLADEDSNYPLSMFSGLFAASASNKHVFAFSSF